MELIITEDHMDSKGDFNLEDLPLAFNYAQDAIVNQRKRINDIISAAMENTLPTIELPFALFKKMEEELKERGWKQKCHQWYQPVLHENPLEQLEIKDDAEKIISAKVFYDATIKQQLAALNGKFENARQKGLAVISLDFPLYKLIAGKLLLRGWDVFVYNEYDSTFGKPHTTIRIK